MMIFRNFFKKDNKKEEIDDIKESLEIKDNENTNDELLNDLVFNDNELVKISEDGILDASSPVAIKKFQHNLKVLVEQAKKIGKLDKFMILRNDNFFPYDFEWKVLSKNTSIEKIILQFSFCLRKQYALESANLIHEIKGIQIPNSQEEIDLALELVDKKIGSVILPSHFRSTKHFTVNTPLDITGKDNHVDMNRDFTIIDSIDNFLISKYAYSISYFDAYLDVTHEPLPISKDAIVLIEKSRYAKISEDPIIANQLKQRKVILFTGEEYVAINMLLTELGVLPSDIGYKYFIYDDEINDIIQNSIKNLAKENGLLYAKNHGGETGHFTDYFDEKNYDYENSIRKLVKFLKSKFPEYSEIITENRITISPDSIIQNIGTNQLLAAIEEYNQLMQKEFEINHNKYKKDRKSITPEISNYFKATVNRISAYFNNQENLNYPIKDQMKIEECILHFYQDDTVKEQLIAANNIWKMLTNTLKIENLESVDENISENLKI